LREENEKILARSYEEEKKTKDTIKNDEKIREQYKEFQGTLVKSIL